MADSTLPNLTAVTTPVTTDVLVTRQSGDTRDKKVTRAQLNTLEAGEVLKIDDGNISGPGLQINGDPNTGIYAPAADMLSFAVGGNQAMRWYSASGGTLARPEGQFGKTAHVGSSQGDGAITGSYNVFSTVGTAGDAATLPAVFSSGTLVYIKNDAAANAMDVFPASGDDLGEGTNTALSIAAGTSATFMATATDSTWTQLIAAAAGGGTDDPSAIAGGSVGAAAYGFTSDANTGLYSPTLDQCGVTVGGKDAVIYKELANQVTFTVHVDDNLTADVASVQGGGIINASYSIYSTCANVGDCATLPASFEEGTMIYVKNDGANSMDVFPASGDTIQGEALNAALAVPAGSSATFCATVDDTTWTNLIISPQGWDGTGYPMLENHGSTAADTDGDGVGFGVWWNNTDTPGNQDGVLFTMNYDATYEAQMYLDWDGETSGGLWYRSNYDSSFVSWRQAQFMVDNFEQSSVHSGTLTAHVGSSQGDGLLANTYNLFSVVANVGDACTLPAIANESAGRRVYIQNTAANAMDVFPNTNDNINGSADNIAVSLAGGDWIEYMARGTEWLKITGGTL